MPQTFFQWVSYLLKEYGSLFWMGTRNTVIIAVLGTAFGFLIGLIVAAVRAMPNEGSVLRRSTLFVSSKLMWFYIFLFRGTPMIVQSMVIYYGALQFFGINMEPMFAAVFIVSINTGAYMAEIIRGGIISVDPGQNEGAYALGMTHWQTMKDVILPQAIKNSLPSIANQLIVNIKDSSVLSVISITELFYQGKRAAGTYMKYFEVFFIVSIIYLILTGVSGWLVDALEKKMNGPDHYEMYDRGCC